MKRFSFLLALPVLLILTLAVGKSSDDLFELRKNFEIFGALYEEIAVNYVDDVRAQPFMRAGIEAMLEQLDPYTYYFDEADMVDMQLQQQRKLGSVGLNLGLKAGRITVLAPESNAAGYRQGVHIGDVILQVGGISAEGLTVQEATDLLTGQPGTLVKVLVQRGTEPATRLFVLPRSRSRSSNVSYSGYLGPDSTEGIAYVRLDMFGNRAGREVRRAFRNMHRDVPLRGMVLDLRGNPGGILAEAIDIVELFVPKGSVVVTTQSRAADAMQEFRTEENALFPDIPLVILVDEFSASASEIVAGALQDYDRAVVLGQTSFGKGLVQIVRQLPHNTALKLTVSHYFLPTGRTIQSAELNTASARVSIPTVLDYTTPVGRTVRGGRGVEPDVDLQATHHPLLTSLQQESAFFLFAGVWLNGTCASEAGCLQDEGTMYASFLDWLEGSNILMSTDAELWLSRFAEEAQSVGFEIDADLERLNDVLQTQKVEQLAQLRPEIVSRIQSQIRLRVLDESEQIAAEVAQDEWIQEADKLVRDQQSVRQILSID
ncbi:MAG: S41 family peptidase [Bacteroidetes Order II. Incertae sedis bacterium]|jgi:carboxyl-terminal processing protease|nr:S41 family peptidase [Bacteroidetes Order II. bacterium]MBT4052381.1 S41 family peptidase [Bacteroidetes Order II. bacterium]MBT4603442.1 S41 family peptidase [Bacteroidetes Order II. bacterium]MBT5249935.1 S41 family peptidase [Bacteroidetes Order II. bacterium]MBT6200651.1 S41 family peptidase [Bacteroidetes Order II. bacterium]